ncbi:MAG: sodium:proton exchanger [Actinomycetota bacterium]
MLFAAILTVCVVTGILHFADAEPVAIFLLAAASLAGLAWMIGVATEAIGARFGPALTGLLQSTLGNLPELFVVLFALSAGEIVVAQTSILGSLFANALLVLGLAIVAGSFAAKDSVMRFRSRLPNDTATLLLLAVFIIVLLGLSNTVGDRASKHAVTISAVGAVCLLVVYALWLWSYLRSDQGEPALEEGSHVPFSFRTGIVVLAVAGVAAALISDWFVAALDPAVEALGISKAFTGLVIVAIAGNAVENLVGVTLAAKGRSDLAISVVKNSVAQIAVFLFPALVLFSLFFENRLTFVLAPVYIGALAVTAIAVWQITGDGQAVAFEGWALVAIYIVLAVLTFYE